LIVRLKAEKPPWGARKIRQLLVRRLDGDVRVPAKSTIHAVLDRHGLVGRGGGPRHRARGTPLGIAIERIKPGHPQQNGRVERMHLTVKRKQPGRPAS
jgi:hypothetical protein